MKDTSKTYQHIKQLEVGQTVVNIGIIKAIFPDVLSNRTKIVFSPCRSMEKQDRISLYFKNTDKLMLA
jgi:hypothetical protein